MRAYNNKDHINEIHSTILRIACRIWINILSLFEPGHNFWWAMPRADAAALILPERRNASSGMS